LRVRSSLGRSRRQRVWSDQFSAHLALRQDRCDVVLEQQAPLLELLKHVIGVRLFRLNVMDTAIDLFIGSRESSEGVVGLLQPFDDRGVFGELVL